MATTFPVRAETGPAVRDIDQLITALRKAGKEAGMTEKEIDDLVKKSSDFGKAGVKGVSEINTGMTGLNKTITSVGATLATVFAVDRLKAFIGNVIDITSEFQKLEAVLTNTLGSKSEAQSAMLQIQKLAATTPFSVRELTENFVKLANRGVKPTTDEMKKMGDVAATLGKPFEQVVEAILDISNSERWREIGLQSEKAGDKMKLTFRGVTNEVDATVEGVTNAVIKFGEMNGVMGATDAIAQTVGGTIRNLDDQYEILLSRIGNNNTGLIKGFADLAASMLNFLNVAMSDPIAEQALKNADTYRATLEEAFGVFKKTGDSGPINQAIQDQVKFTNEWRESVKALEEQMKGMSIARGFTAKEIENTRLQLEVERKTLAELTQITQDYINKVRDAGAQVKTLSKEQLEWLEKLKTARFELSGQDDKFIMLYRRQREEAEQTKKTIEELLNVLNKSAGQDPLTTPIDPFAMGPEPTDEINGLKTKEEIEAEKQALQQATFDHAIDLINQLQSAQQAAARTELDWINYRYQEEMKLAGDNNAAKEKIGAEFARKERELQNKQAAQQQQMALFNILSSQGPAIAKLFMTNPFPQSLPLALLLGAQFALLVGNQKKISPPRFKDGVYGLDGAGTETSDSIFAMLSRNESVVPADRSKQFKDLLKPMIEADNFSYNDVKRIVDAKLPGLAAPIIITGNSGNDSMELLNEVKATRKAIEQKKEVRLNFDEKGFGQWIGNEGNWTKYVRKRYSM